MPFRPTQDYILVRPIERKASQVIDVIHHEKHCRGEIIAVGPGKRAKKTDRLIPLVSKPGQIVAFGDGNFDFYPRWYDENDICFRIIQEADICFVIEGDAWDTPVKIYDIATDQQHEREAVHIIAERERLLA